MGSIALDNGESVYVHDGTGSADPVAISGLEGSSVANLMKNRERFDYTWANASERTSQTGMVQGSRGYQEDVKAEYLYDNSAWRLALPYIEFTATTTVSSNNTLTNLGVFSVDATSSTDTAIVTPGANGILRFTNPGVYSVSLLVQMTTGGTPAPANGRTFIEITVPPGYSDIVVRANINTAEDAGSVALPALRVSSSNYDLQFDIHKNTATASISAVSRVRIARLG